MESRRWRRILSAVSGWPEAASCIMQKISRKYLDITENLRQAKLKQPGNNPTERAFYLNRAVLSEGCKAVDWCTIWWEAAVTAVPEYICSIFLLSSWANAKVTSTKTKRMTTIFLSDKTALIKWFVVRNMLQSNYKSEKTNTSFRVFSPKSL